MRTVICPGSFDPITLGHLDIITRSSKMFDKVIVLVMTNHLKKNSYSFSAEERIEMIKLCTKNLPNVEVDTYDGLLADYAHGDVDTVFVTTRAENMYLSSSVVKHICSLGADISKFVPPEVAQKITQRIRRGVEK